MSYRSEDNEFLLKLSEKEIELYNACGGVVKRYTELRDTIGGELLARMKANDIKELGKVKIVEVPYYESVEIEKLFDTILNEQLVKAIVVNGGY